MLLVTHIERQGARLFSADGNLILPRPYRVYTLVGYGIGIEAQFDISYALFRQHEARQVCVGWFVGRHEMPFYAETLERLKVQQRERYNLAPVYNILRVLQVYVRHRYAATPWLNDFGSFNTHINGTGGQTLVHDTEVATGTLHHGLSNEFITSEGETPVYMFHNLPIREIYPCPTEECTRILIGQAHHLNHEHLCPRTRLNLHIDALALRVEVCAEAIAVLRDARYRACHQLIDAEAGLNGFKASVVLLRTYYRHIVVIVLHVPLARLPVHK